jgi:hypothetical protein
MAQHHGSAAALVLPEAPLRLQGLQPPLATTVPARWRLVLRRPDCDGDEAVQVYTLSASACLMAPHPGTLVLSLHGGVPAELRPQELRVVWVTRTLASCQGRPEKWEVIACHVKHLPEHHYTFMVSMEATHIEPYPGAAGACGLGKQAPMVRAGGVQGR